MVPRTKVLVETEVKKSRFICHLSHAETAEQARLFIETIRIQYPEACHHCWAFQTEEPESTRSIGCSDDGEPHGTAGKPMLNVLNYCGIGEIVAVVARIYGGTKLGTGGLARAYAQSVKNALEQLPLIEKTHWQETKIEFEYSLQPGIEQLFQRLGVEIVAFEFKDTVSLQFRYDLTKHNELNQQLKDLTKGKLSLKC